MGGFTGLEKALWHYQIDALAPQLNTLALDLPGHGESDAPALARVEDYAAGVMRWIDTLKLPQPIPCGLSLGGAIVLQMLLDRLIVFFFFLLQELQGLIELDVADWNEPKVGRGAELIGEAYGSAAPDSEAAHLRSE